jgi:GTPase SAR1 family protein
MFEKLKALLLSKSQDVKKTETTKTIVDTNVVINNLDVFKTPEGQGRWTLVIGAEGQGKTYFVKEIAKKSRTFAYVEAEKFQSVQNVDLFIIDDLHKANQQKQQEIFEFLCGARHQNIKNIICVTQELKGIPSEVIRRFKVIAFFYSAKQHMKLQTVVKGGLKEASQMADKIIRLLPRQYYLYDVQSGYFSEPIANIETSTILKAMCDVLPNKIREHVDKIKLENGEKLTRDNIKITPLIVKMLREHPEYKYKYIAQQLQTSTDYVKKVASKWQRGLLKY